MVSVSGLEIEAVGPMGSGDPVILCIRSENVILSEIVQGSREARKNVFPATVVRITPMGFYQKVQLNCGFPLVTYVTSHALSALSIKHGTDVFASFDARAVHVIRKGLPTDP